MNTAGVYGYGLEFRTRIVALVLDGATPEEAARHFAVHVNTVKRYLERHRNNTLHVRVKPTGRHWTVTAAHEDQLLKQLEAHPDATLTEHACTGLKIYFKTVDRVFTRLQIIHKKTLVALERREDQRTAFLNDLEPYLTRPERLVFLDESGFQTNMTRGYARAPRHFRAVCASPRNHGHNQSLICALSLAGPVAPLVMDGPLNGEVFEWSVREELVPALKPGQVVVLDNLSSHHLASIRTLIKARGCTLLYLSPYSPDFNPIEMLFSKMKALVRGAAPRTVPNVIANIGIALQAVLPAEIRGWFKHAHPRLLL